MKEDVAFFKSQFTSDSKDVNAEYYYSVRKVCEFLGISASTLYNWIKELKFPAGQLVGGRRRFLGSEVQAWLDMEKRGH